MPSNCIGVWITFNYSFISNGYGSALISPECSIDWLALPRFDSSPIFCSILDDYSNCNFRIDFGETKSIGRRYLHGALILEHMVETGKGNALIRDLMPRAESAMMRYIRSEAPFEIRINPSFQYGMISPAYRLMDKGAVYSDPTNRSVFEVKFHWSSDVRTVDKGRWEFGRGNGYIMMLFTNDEGYGLFSRKSGVYSVPREAMQSTLNYWRTILKSCEIHPPHWARKSLETSLKVALGLIYSPSNAIIAAPTTSLPEIPGQGRNWDYRFAWVRDASFAAEALIKAGFIITGREILDFLFSVLDPSRKPFNHVLYAVDGGPPPSERSLNWLSGYMCSRPVRVGNAAHLQIQLDIEGEFMKALEVYYRNTDDTRYISKNWWAVESIARFCKANYTKKDAGIWEDRGENKHYTHSKVMMWSALETASYLAGVMGNEEEAESWGQASRKLKPWIIQGAWNERVGSFVKSFGSSDVDASLLTMPLYGFIDAKDKRFEMTLERIAKELVIDHLVFRYRSDFMGKTSNPFGLASSWMARVYILRGERAEAVKYIKKLIECTNDLGLLGEHIDLKTHEPRGNFPQLFSHIGLIEAIADLQMSVNT